MFDSDDWEGIQTISMSHKENKLLKVGRFALGFISVYHVTGDTFTIFNLHQYVYYSLSRLPLYSQQ